MRADPRARATRLALPALFAALTAAGAFIALPLPGSPVPIVVQNLVVVLSGLLLGPLRGGVAVLLFLGLGALGFPVFSGGHGGLAWMAGPTGGYLAGYLVAALVAGWLALRPRPWRLALGSVLGFVLILALGVLRLKLLKNVAWPKALALGVLPFLPGDAVKALVAALLALRLRPFLDRIMAGSLRPGPSTEAEEGAKESKGEGG